jgi:hypothetical protein
MSMGAHSLAADTRLALPRHRGLLLALLMLLAFGAAAQLNDSVRHQLALSFIPQPSDYTELYFATGRPVEAVVDGNLETVSVQFTVANHEGRTIIYPYTVALADRAGIPVARVADSLTISADGAVTKEVRVAVPTSTPWTAVDVSLSGRAERLHLLQSEWTKLLNHSGSLSRGAVEGAHGVAGAGVGAGQS